MTMTKRTKRILIVAASVLVVAATITGLVLRANTAHRARTTIVGFYDIEGAQQQAVQSVLERAFSALPEVQAANAATVDNALVLEFVTLSDEQAADPKLTKKIDVLVTQTGALTSRLMSAAVPVNNEIMARFPRSTQSSPFFSQDGKMLVMPLFLDHFETAYYTILSDELTDELPYYLSEFAEYAALIKDSIVYPIIASGADDTVLFSMVSVLVESVAGADGYNQLIRDISDIAGKDQPFDDVLALPLKGDAPDGIIFGDILQVFRNWRSEGLILGNWQETTEASVRVFMEDYHTGIIQMLLSQHRRMPYPMIKYYESTQYPADTSVSRALIAPSVSCMLFTDTNAARSFVDALSSADEQEFLSVKTQLAPTTLRGQSFDMQADDVRYFAAISAGGPVPDLGHAAFATSEKRAEFAAWLRDQLR